VAGERVAREVGDLARELDAGRTGADDHERQPGVALGVVPAVSASSKALRIRVRIRKASSSDFIPGASRSHSSWPK
jgi:hypothetical protein